MPFKIKPPSLLLLVATIILHACNPDDPEVKDTESPSVEFVQASQEKFAGTVELAFNLADNNALSHIQVFIDNNLILEKTLTSKSETVDLTWDTKTVDDGHNILKVITTDVNGNKNEKDFDVIVKNILMTITIPDGYVGVNTEKWIYISDHSGNVLGTQKVINNSKLKFFSVDGFAEETLMIHLFTYSTAQIGDITSIYREIKTYTPINVGDLIMKSSQPGQPYISKEVINVTIDNMPPNYHATVSGSSYANSGAYSDESTYKLQTYPPDDQADILLTLYSADGEGWYKLLKDINEGSDITVSFKDFTPMNRNILSVPGASDYFQIEIGFRPGDPISAGYMYNVFSSTEAKLHSEEIYSYYPQDEIFSSYTSFTSVSYPGETNDYSIHDNHHHTEFKKLDISVASQNFSDNHLKLKINGDAQTVAVNYTGIYSNGNLYIQDIRSFDMIFKSEIDLILPAIPSEIMSVYYPDGFIPPTYNNITFGKGSDGFLNYNDRVERLYVNEVQNDPSVNYEYLTKVLYFNNTTSNGRIDDCTKPGISSQNLPVRDRAIVTRFLQSKHR